MQWHAAFWNLSVSNQACLHISMGIPTFSSFQLKTVKIMYVFHVIVL